MQHDLIHPLRRIGTIPFAPIITHTIRKDISRAIEIRRRDAAAHFRIPLESMLGVFIPEMKGPVRAGGAESAVLRVEGKGVDAVDVCVVRARAGVAMAFE